MSGAPGNVYISTTAPNVREDLADIIYRIDPDEVPVVSATARVAAKQVLTEWLVQELNPVINNAQPEGFTAVIQPSVKPLRINNVCQILARTVGVSNTLRVVDVAGGEDEYNRQLILRGLEVKRDLEYAVTAPLIKTISDPRHMSGLPSYCTNGVRGTGGSFGPGDGTSVGTPGTTFDLTLQALQTSMQMCWQAGGKPNLAVMSGSIKLWFTNMSQGGSGNAIVSQNMQLTTAREQIELQGAVDVFRSDFGTLQLAPDRFMPPNMIELISTDYLELAPLPERDMVNQDYAVTGDNAQGGVVFEGCLRPTAPKAHAWITDLNQ